MIKTKFTGNKKVDVEVNGFTVHTDLPASEHGDNSAPNPFDLFLSSFAACNAIFALLYTEKAKISKDGISIIIEPQFAKDGCVTSAKVVVNVPKDFPKEHEKGLVTMVEHCKVGKHLNFPHEVVLIRK